MHQAQRGTRTPSRGSASLSSPPAAVATGSAALPIEGGSSPASTGLGSLNRQPSVRMASPPMKAGTRGGREATPTPTRITPSSSTGVKSPFHSDSPPNYAGMRSYKKTPTSTSHPIHSITHSPETRSVINRWTPNLRLREPGQEAEVFYTQPAALKVNFTKETIASIKKYFALLALTLEFSEGAMQPLNEVNIFDTSISASMRCADLNTPAGKSQLLNIEYLICLAMSLIQDARLHQARGVTDISSILTIIKNIHQLVVSNAQLQKLLSDDKATLIEHARDAEMKQVLSFLAVDMEVMKGFLEHCDTGAKAQNYYRPEVKAGYTYPPKPLHYYNKDYVAKRAARIRPGMINWLAKYYDLQAEKKHAPAPFKVISKEMSRQKDMVIDPVIPAIKEKDPTKLAAHLTEQVKQGGATLIKIKALIVQMTHLRVDEADKRRELNDELLLSLAIAKLSIDQTLQTLKLIESMTSRVPVEHKSSIEDQVRLLSGIEGADAPQGLILQFREMLLKHHDELIKDPHISDFAGRLALAIEISSLVIDVFPDMSVIATSVAAATAALPKRVSVVPAHSRGSVSQLASATIANPMLAAVTSRGSLPTISAQPTVRKSVVLEPGAEAGLEMTAIPGEVPVEAATTASGSVNAGAVRVTKRDSTVTPHTGAVPRASTLVPSYAARATTTEIINPLARSSLVAPPTNARSSLPVTAVIGVVDASSEESATPTKRSQVTAQYAVRRSKVAVDMNASLLAPEVLAGMVNDYIFAQNTMAVQDLLSLAQVTKLNIQAQGSDVLATSGRASIAVEPYKLAPKDRTAKIIENALQKKLQGRKRTITGISCIAILLGAGAIVGGAIAAVENKKTTGAASPVPADGNTTSTQTATPYPSGLSPSTGVSILSSISYSPTAEAYSATSSATYGASASVTSNVNPSASVTATALNSATGTSSITAQASQSSSENPLASMSSTPVNSATSTPVTPISASASNSESASLSLTPASSVSSSVSGTHTASTTAIVTPSATSSETASLGASLSQTATFSPTPSPSTTLSRTASATPSSTATNSDTTSQTASASRSATQSETLTPTSTAAVTPSITPSNTHTGTQSGSLTASLSNTPSGTQTATMSFTPTGTLTQTGTGSGSITPTNSVSGTLTGTGSLSATVTPSITGTGSITSSQSITSSRSPGACPSGTNFPNQNANTFNLFIGTSVNLPACWITITGNSATYTNNSAYIFNGAGTYNCSNGNNIVGGASVANPVQGTQYYLTRDCPLVINSVTLAPSSRLLTEGASTSLPNPVPTVTPLALTSSAMTFLGVAGAAYAQAEATKTYLSQIGFAAKLQSVSPGLLGMHEYIVKYHEGDSTAALSKDAPFRQYVEEYYQMHEGIILKLEDMAAIFDLASLAKHTQLVKWEVARLNKSFDAHPATFVRQLATLNRFELKVLKQYSEKYRNAAFIDLKQAVYATYNAHEQQRAALHEGKGSRLPALRGASHSFDRTLVEGVFSAEFIDQALKLARNLHSTKEDLDTYFSAIERPETLSDKVSSFATMTWGIVGTFASAAVTLVTGHTADHVRAPH